MYVGMQYFTGAPRITRPRPRMERRSWKSHGSGGIASLRPSSRAPAARCPSANAPIPETGPPPAFAVRAISRTTFHLIHSAFISPSLRPPARHWRSARSSRAHVRSSGGKAIRTWTESAGKSAPANGSNSSRQDEYRNERNRPMYLFGGCGWNPPSGPGGLAGQTLRRR
jgi:hypothetical protein